MGLILWYNGENWKEVCPMEYEHSLTYAVQMQVDGYIQTRGAQAAPGSTAVGAPGNCCPF